MEKQAQGARNPAGDILINRYSKGQRNLLRNARASSPALRSLFKIRREEIRSGPLHTSPEIPTLRSHLCCLAHINSWNAIGADHGFTGPTVISGSIALIS